MIEQMIRESIYDANVLMLRMMAMMNDLEHDRCTEI